VIEAIGAVLVAWVAADFLTGTVHWFEDRYLDEHTPFLGGLVGGPNVLHHHQPTAMLKGSYFERNYTTLVPALFLMVIAFVFDGPLWVLLMFAFASQANEIHAWSHWAGKVSWPIRMIQETGIVQSAKHHAEHHRSPHRIRYCVMSEWLNPFLDRMQFWTGCEWFMMVIFNLYPLDDCEHEGD
jgi:hypothetical protein